jgi:DNA (cytosine-5)-methyltransferase 1
MGVKSRNAVKSSNGNARRKGQSVVSAATIPVVDLFAGPGGLGEGFEAFESTVPRRRFRVVLSIECDRWAHRTLELRSFFRTLQRRQMSEAYDQYLHGKVKREELFAAYPLNAKEAAAVARKAKLGEVDPKIVDRWIHGALGPARKTGKWVLVGGPPCQAYSLVGRARRSRESRDKFESDERHSLYKEYLRILKDHQPAVFVMENVKGILSASLSGERIFGKICNDLSAAGYDLHSLSGDHVRDLAGSWNPASFVVCSERYGIPQARHRVFIVGIRRGMQGELEPLSRVLVPMTVQDAIGDLPRLKSLLSNRRGHRLVSWERARNEGLSLAKSATNGSGMQSKGKFQFRATGTDAPMKTKLPNVVNHEARSHISEDISRYAFVAEFAIRNGRSPTLADFPRKLLPKHRNASLGTSDVPFADRFRVQMANKPSSTITSHISKDGHYYIHPDPFQARSLTVREAARLQTFPDNYLFEGPRTEQYKQVGNAVPPMLAMQIASRISSIFRNTP